MNTEAEAPQKRFTLTITEKQGRVIARALELQQRVHMGQLEHVAFELHWAGRFTTLEDSEEARQKNWMTWERRDLLQTLLRGLSPLVTELGSPSASLGIRHEAVSDDARISYDLQQVIRYALWQADDRPDKARYVVDADKPYRTSQQEALAAIAAVPQTSLESENA